ncbi:hypothetical protein [Uliginosibacterium sp. 31-12]|uniref:hypothetical protein n=1 Tax=Uliginosibacterium sp. 31-12 TaxID=3062781 RepID=UPI0026E301AF|nr:hypothetical protein [Uliginosibacterium sp. 31-12]MDO6387880.1 hypothetical protein [Uliginosibacterium sp. 31-12]
MKGLISMLALSILSTSVWADPDPSKPDPLQSGDQVSNAFRKYVQDAPGSEPVLENRTLTYSYAIESDSASEILLRYGNGSAEVLDKKLAVIASISKTGERRAIPADAVEHWMPKTELKPGMKWSFENHWESPASNESAYVCRFDGEFKARSSASERDVSINGQIVRLPVTVVDIEGKTYLQVCEGAVPYTRERRVYSKDLHLVLEHEYLSRDPFGKLFEGWLQTVTAVTTKNRL